MRMLLTGHKGYIGAVAAPVLLAAGHEVVDSTLTCLRAATSDRPVRPYLKSKRIFVT